jgi:hypothetical protein
LRVPRTRHERGRCDEATSGQETNKKALAIHVSGLLYERRAFRPGYQRISQSAKGNLMQIKGAEASAKPGATAHQNAWQRWSHGQFNDRSGSKCEELALSISGPLLPSKAVIRAACRVVAFEPGAVIAAIRRTGITEYWSG